MNNFHENKHQKLRADNNQSLMKFNHPHQSNLKNGERPGCDSQNQYLNRHYTSSEGIPYNNIFRSFDDIKDPGERFRLDNLINKGVYGSVYSAVDIQAGHNKIAVKIQVLSSETQDIIIEEYQVLRDLSGHPNIPNFYGIYHKHYGMSSKVDEIWFIMELCDGGTIMDVVRQLTTSGKKLREEHLRYVLREVIKAVIYLHENNIIHRDIKGDNILLTKDGEVKLADFGFAKSIKKCSGQLNFRIGSPSWIAPEVAACGYKINKGYGVQADVWSIGITAIELAEGKAPYQDMHPSRILFQIMRNPPPSLHRASNWSTDFVDFLTECLERNPENRPAMAEIILHPFIEEVPNNDFTLMQDLKSLLANVKSDVRISRPLEYIVWGNRFKTNHDGTSKVMLTEDLAALEIINEETVLSELSQRLSQGYFHTFIGDTLVILNPNEVQDIYGTEFHEKYNFKSRSDNEPHIYSVADKAYQDVLHNEEAQHIIFAGESSSGKTSNVLYLIDHLMYLGKGLNDVGIGVSRAIKIIHSFCHVSTSINYNATRCINQICLTFGPTGKASGVVYSLYQLDKWCISSSDKNRSNFCIFYYLYDAMEAKGKLQDYGLPLNRKVHYLQSRNFDHINKFSVDVRIDREENLKKFENINEIMILMEFDSYVEVIWKTLSSILLIGEINFITTTNNDADIENIKVANFVADFLGLDQKKFTWSLTNYCLIKRGTAIRRKYTSDEAFIARDVLACTLYQRLVDWIINFINFKLSVTRALLGSKYSISIMDFFGFECFTRNRVDQLIINSTNEILQCYYNQKIFLWEMQEYEEEQTPIIFFNFYDNQEVIEQLMDKKYGIFQIIDQASRQFQDTEFILNKYKYYKKNSHVKIISSHEFSVAHYTGKVTYDIADIVDKNRDFVSPEMINTMRLSSLNLIKQIFIDKLTRAGNLISDFGLVEKQTDNKISNNHSSLKTNKNFVIPKEQYSQTKKMRSYTSTFRNVCVEILKKLSMNQKNGGFHFIRCIRADLKKRSRGFNHEIVAQQIKALGVIETACIRQEGYAYRIPFREFLRRYQFLAFDFGEKVDITKDNCRLLLIRLKMEGWMIGKSKIFLKYYNEEYLSRLYETQVRKIIKIQSMLRAFLACKRLNKAAQKKKMNDKKVSSDKKKETDLSEEEAALLIQKTYRGHAMRKELHSQQSTIDQNTIILIQFYCIKWKLKTIYQILLQYRAKRFHQLVQLSQQVHLFNQSFVDRTSTQKPCIDINTIDPTVEKYPYLGEKPCSVHKLPFNFYQDFFDFSAAHLAKHPQKLMKNGSNSSSASDEDNETWNSALHRDIFNGPVTKITKKNIGVQTTNSPHRSEQKTMNYSHSIINTPFTRDLLTTFNQFPLQGKEFQNNKIASQTFPDHWNGNIAAHTKLSNSISGSQVNHHFVEQPRLNPINELRSIGKNHDYNESDEEQPFNFQAILRKTSHQRQSMKRNQIYEKKIQSILSQDRPPKEFQNIASESSLTDDLNVIGVYRPKIHTELSNDNSNGRSTIKEDLNFLVSSEIHLTEISKDINENMQSKTNLMKEKDVDGRKQNKSLDTSNILLLKLAPGVTVEGYCANF